MERPTSVEMALWLNQFRVGTITKTDATNALETITETLGFQGAETTLTWSALVEFVAGSKTPVMALLPSPGMTFGLPAEVLAQYVLPQGVLIFNDQQALGLSVEPEFGWRAITLDSSVPHHDVQAARRHLLALTEISSKQLASYELQGDRSNVDTHLQELRPIYLPPALPSRTKTDLELAERIWLIAEFGLVDATSHSSPSTDQLRINALRELKLAALELMVACSTVA